MTTHREAAQTVFDQLAKSEDGNPHYRQIDMDTLVLIFETGTKAARKAVLDERESCAVIADNMQPATGDIVSPDWYYGAACAATAIRNRQ